MGNQEHSKLCELPELYVLGGLTSEEQKEFEDHLKECSNCREAVSDLAPVADMLPYATEQMQPPEGMKRRILAKVLGEEGSRTHVSGTDATNAIDRGGLSESDGEAVHAQARNLAEEPDPLSPSDLGMKMPMNRLRQEKEAQPRTGRKAWERWPIAGLSAAAIVLFVYSMIVTDQKYDLKNQIAEKSTDVEQLQQQLAEANSPDYSTKQLVSAVTLSPAAKDVVADGLATIVIDDKGTHLIVQAENMPALQNTEAYQVWLLKDGKPQNAGTFLTTNGNGALYFTFEGSDFDSIAITQEPDANGTQPRGEIVLSAKLS